MADSSAQFPIRMSAISGKQTVSTYILICTEKNLITIICDIGFKNYLCSARNNQPVRKENKFVAKLFHEFKFQQLLEQVIDSEVTDTRSI